MIDLATILGLTAPIIVLLVATVIVHLWTARRRPRPVPAPAPPAVSPAQRPVAERDAPPTERRRVAA